MWIANRAVKLSCILLIICREYFVFCYFSFVFFWQELMREILGAVLIAVCLPHFRWPKVTNVFESSNLSDLFEVLLATIEWTCRIAVVVVVVLNDKCRRFWVHFKTFSPRQEICAKLLRSRCNSFAMKVHRTLWCISFMCKTCFFKSANALYTWLNYCLAIN